jgi:hypothetical protein
MTHVQIHGPVRVTRSVHADRQPKRTRKRVKGSIKRKRRERRRRK